MPPFRRFKKRKLIAKRPGKLVSTIKKVVRKAERRDLKTLSMHLRKGERTTSYKGHPVAQVMHTKFTLAQAGILAPAGQFTFKVNSLQDYFQQGYISGGTYYPPTLFPAWYHQFLNTYLFNNYAVYGSTVELTIVTEASSPQTEPVMVAWFEPSEQPESGITTMDQALMQPGVKTAMVGSYGSGYKNMIKMKRHFDNVDFMGNAFDVSYTGTYSGVQTISGTLTISPTNGLFCLVQFYDITSGNLITSGDTMSISAKVVFDVSLFGFKYVPIT